MSDPLNVQNDRCARTGVLGAGGYTGARLMQMAEMRPGSGLTALIRGHRSLGRLSASPPPFRIVDTRTAESLAEGMRGLQTVVNLTLGNISSIAKETQMMAEACRLAGVRHFIHASSAVVYGRVEQPLDREDAPPASRLWMLYAREKAAAEQAMHAEIARGGLRITVLRPGLIWGPGSGWAAGTAAQIRGGMTLLRGGTGIVNLVYVDNLAEMILRAAEDTGTASGFYNARDRETLTWGEFARAMAAELGLPAENVRTVPGDELLFSPKRVLESLLQRRPLYNAMRGVLKRLSPEAKQALKRRVLSLTGGGPTPPADTAAAATTGEASTPKLTREHWTLQTTCHPLPAEGFERTFGPLTLTRFPEALARTAAWLQFTTAGPA